MPEARIVESAHQPRQPVELYRLPYRKAGQHREHAQADHRGVRMFLKWVVGFTLLRFRTEEEVVLHHGPDAWDVAMSDQNLPIGAAEDLIADVDHARGDVNPHEGEVPLQRAAEPSADRE